MANNKNMEYLRRPDIKVLRAHRFGDGTETADLSINGVCIYGVTVRASRDGGEFLAWPSKQGKDGKWYAIARAPLAAEDVAYTVKLIRDELA